MNKKIAWSVLVSAGLALGACGTKDDGDSGTGPSQMDDGPGDTGPDTDSATSGNTNPTTGMTSGMDSGEESGGSSGNASVGFIEDPDGGGIDFECDLWAQDCPEGQKCMPWANDGGSAWNATRCSDVDPNPGQPGDSCTVEGNGVSGIDTCDTAVMCWDVDGETNTGTCVAMCTGDESNPSCDDPDTSCAIANDGAIILCLPNCDPVLQDCAEGQACYPIGEIFTCAPDASGEMGGAGDPCEYINACDAGNFCGNPAANTTTCTDQGALGCCIPFCEVSNNQCDNGEMCLNWYEMGMIPPGFEDTGFCTTG
ncbi:MAG: ribulose phosphate epimerase [Myxococcales bacterium]|nr:ribulose phosphate epimerase [Myxococcales bacterium]